MLKPSLYTDLITEFKRAKETLIKRIPKHATRDAVKETLHATLALCTQKQAVHIAKQLPRSFRLGFNEAEKEIKATVKAQKKKGKVTSAVAVPSSDVTFDFTKVSKTHLNKITRDTIGDIGRFNKEISKTLLTKYDVLVANNALVNSIAERGFTEHTEAQLLKAGISKEMVGVIKSQSTTNKMLSILNTQGIKGGLPPNQVSKLLIPEIRAVFGPEGVVIDNIGKTRNVLRVNASGDYWWTKVKIKQPYRTTTKNYADLLASTNMKRAHNEGRLATMKASGLVEKYRFISAQTGNTCLTCLGMHGLIVSPADTTPPIHVKCYCTLTPVYKDPTLNLHGDEYYMKQRDAGLWRKHQFNTYNKELLPVDRIPNPNFLPPDVLKGMPSGVEMAKIRTGLLGGL